MTTDKEPKNPTSPTQELEQPEHTFETQLQEMLWVLAERDPKLEVTAGFGETLDTDPEHPFNVGVSDRLSGQETIRELNIDYKGVRATIRKGPDGINDISNDALGTDEARSVDWTAFDNQEDAPVAVKAIAARMQELLRGDAEPITGEWFDEVTESVWEVVRQIDAPVHYSSYQSYELKPGAKTWLSVFSDMPDKQTGKYLPDSEKPAQSISITAPGWYYHREVQSGEVRESFSEEIDRSALPDLTEEERKRHPYVVIPAEMAVPDRDDEVSISIDGTSAEPIEYPTSGYTVISADVSGAVQTIVKVWQPTEAEAQKTADDWYKDDLARERSDTTLTPERQKKILGLLTYWVSDIREADAATT